MSSIQLIVGLGNPGPEYVATRHNVGFWFVEELAYRLKATPFKDEKKFFGKVAKANVNNKDVWLLKPETFMNRSGQSVLALAHFYKIPPENILVIHDELDILPGTVKFKQGGGNGGHNGLKDIQSKLSSPNFWRLRLGIGHPGDKNLVSNFVLKKPLAAEQAAIDETIYHSLESMNDIFSGDYEAAKRHLHGKKIS